MLPYYYSSFARELCTVRMFSPAPVMPTGVSFCPREGQRRLPSWPLCLLFVPTLIRIFGGKEKTEKETLTLVTIRNSWRVSVSPCCVHQRAIAKYISLKSVYVCVCVCVCVCMHAAYNYKFGEARTQWRRCHCSQSASEILIRNELNTRSFFFQPFVGHQRSEQSVFGDAGFLHALVDLMRRRDWTDSSSFFASVRAENTACNCYSVTRRRL